jgi:hypothetical protein
MQDSLKFVDGWVPEPDLCLVCPSAKGKAGHNAAETSERAVQSHESCSRIENASNSLRVCE